MLFTQKLASVVIMPLMALQFTTVSINEPQPENTEPQIIELSPKEYIHQYAQQYGVSEDLLLKVAICESNLNQSAVNRNEPNGILSSGIYQYQEPTWLYFNKLYGDELDINSYHDQIKRTAQAISDGKGKNWSCYNKIKGI